MRAINNAFEDVAAFEQFRESLEKRNELAEVPVERRFAIVERQEGENRAAWRARVKAEQKAAKKLGAKA